MKAIAKKPSKEHAARTKPAAGCKCLAMMQKEAESRGFRFQTVIQIFGKNAGGEVGPLLATERLDWKTRGKKLPLCVCAYCPFCGKKQPH